MERTAVRRRLTWQLARVVEVVTENTRTKSLVLDAADWPGHLAGQHVDVRLTAEDGYQAQRSYSIASAPEDEHLVITVERLDDGEVSPYLTETVARGRPRAARPDRRLLRLAGGARRAAPPVGGGSAWCRCGRCSATTARSRSDVPVRLLYSARTQADLIYREELAGYDTVITLTSEQPQSGRAARAASTRALLDEVAGRRRSSRSSTSAVRPDSSRRSPTRSSRSATTEPHQDGKVRPDMIAARRQRDRRRPASRSWASTSPPRRASARPVARRASSPRRSSTCAGRAGSRAAGRAARCCGARDDPRDHVRRPARHHRAPMVAAVVTQTDHLPPPPLLTLHLPPIRRRDPRAVTSRFVKQPTRRAQMEAFEDPRSPHEQALHAGHGRCDGCSCCNRMSTRSPRQMFGLGLSFLDDGGVTARRRAEVITAAASAYSIPVGNAPPPPLLRRSPTILIAVQCRPCACEDLRSPPPGPS